MECPRCDDSELEERDRDGVTVDLCRACRGVWLDRGELEKIVAGAAREGEAYERGGLREDVDDDGDANRWRSPEDGRRHPRKRSWFESLGDLFD